MSTLMATFRYRLIFGSTWCIWVNGLCLEAGPAVFTTCTPRKNLHKHTRLCIKNNVRSNECQNNDLSASLVGWAPGSHIQRFRSKITAETAALAYCDALTEGDQPGFDAVHRALAVHLQGVEIAELASIVINMNLWTRLKLAQGATPVFEQDEDDQSS